VTGRSSLLTLPDAAGEPIRSVDDRTGGRLRLVCLENTAELLADAARWDRLWYESTTTIPTARAAAVAQWCRQFAPQAQVRFIAVAQADRYLAALPLVEQRLAGLLRVGGLPTNPWLTCGDLIAAAPVDSPETTAALDVLAAALDRWVPWSLLWLNEASLGQPHWQALIAALNRRGTAHDVRLWADVGKLTLGDDWAAYRASWSRRHRQRWMRQRRRLEALGPLRLRRVRPRTPEELEAALREAFAIEHRSWKGRDGTSVLSTPGMFGYFLAQAKPPAVEGRVELAFLDVANQPAAFILGLHGKGVFHSCKIAYEPQWAEYSPGQVLRGLLLEDLFAQRTDRCENDREHIAAIDFQGALTSAHRAWRPDCYAVGRLAIGLGPTGRTLLMLLRALRPVIRSAKWAALWKSRE